MDMHNINRFYATNTANRTLNGMGMNTFDGRYQQNINLPMIIGVGAALLLAVVVIKTLKK